LDKMRREPSVSMRAKVCEIIHSRPGITQLELARAGPLAYTGLVKAICRQLLDDGYVARTGKGGPQDPSLTNGLASSGCLAPITARR
jgi:hypothetical protein